MDVDEHAGHVRGPVPRLRVALLRPGNTRINGLRDQLSSTRSSYPPRAVRMYMHSEAASKDSDVVRPALKPLHDCLQQVEKYDSSVCSEGQVRRGGEGGWHVPSKCALRSRCCRRSADCLCTMRGMPCLVEHCLCCRRRVGRGLVVVVVSVSTLVSDIFKAACSFSCVIRPGFLVKSAVLSYVLVHATDVLLTAAFPFLPVLEHSCVSIPIKSAFLFFIRETRVKQTWYVLKVQPFFMSLQVRP